MNLVSKNTWRRAQMEQVAVILTYLPAQAHELVDALLVNPYDTEVTADAIHRALDMAPEEKRARMSRMRSYVREQQTSSRWAAT